MLSSRSSIFFPIVPCPQYNPNTGPSSRFRAAPIISHQAVGYALADAKMAIEAVRSLSLRAAYAFGLEASQPTLNEVGTL